MNHDCCPRSRRRTRADDRHHPLLQRAIANAGEPWIAIILCALLASCGKEPVAASAPAAPPSADARITELVETLRPLAETVTSDVTDQRFIRSQELLAELRAGGRDTGLAALEALRHVQQAPGQRMVDIERGLLDVAAHAAPEDTEPLLVTLVTQYGASLDLRTEAVLLLADTSPKRAIEVLEPMVTRTRANQTMPPPEFIVRSWVTACDKTGRSPVKELANVATNLYQDDAARTRAVNELRRYKEPLASQALQAILIESTGNGYLRRRAAQGLRDMLSPEESCDIFERVASREADINMAKFLADMLDKHCHR